MKTVNFFLICVISFFICVISIFAQTSEEITITTYYPSPYGVYNELQTNRLMVGAGVMPDDDGVVNFQPLAADPMGAASNTEGALYYNTTSREFRYHDGTNWRTFGGGGDFTPITPVPFELGGVGVWTAVNLAGAVPAGTREVGGYVTIQTNCSGPGSTGIVSIASRADGTGEKTFGFIANLQCLNIRIPFRLALLEDRRLFYQTAGQITSWTGITISEFK